MPSCSFSTSVTPFATFSATLFTILPTKVWLTSSKVLLGVYGLVALLSLTGNELP